MSTEKSSGPSDTLSKNNLHLLSDRKMTNETNDSNNLKVHKFEEVLESQFGDITVIMRIGDDMKLLERILMSFRNLADRINLSMHI